MEKRPPPRPDLIRQTALFPACGLLLVGGITLSASGEIRTPALDLSDLCVCEVVRGRKQLDLTIAATALEHGLIVLTRNVWDFQATGVPVLNPFNPQPQRKA
jgi:hypothetical protein